MRARRQRAEMTSKRLRPCGAVGRNAAGEHGPAADAAHMHVEHVQSEVVAVARLLRRPTPRFVRKAIVDGLDADLDFGQGDGPKVRDEDYVPERSDPGNRNRPDAFHQLTFKLRIAVPLS